MAITNRDLDVSEQKRTFSFSIGTKLAPNVTAATMCLGQVPYPSALVGLNLAGHGLSGAPQVELRIQRFIAGAGFTMLAPGVSAIVPSMGVSGPVGVSLPAAGHSLVQLLTGDVLTLLTAVANTSTDTVTGGFVLKALQDFKADYGSST